MPPASTAVFPEDRVLRITALLGIMMISFSAIFVRFAGVSPSTSAFYRAAYALPAIALAAWLLQRHRKRPFRDRVLAFVGGAFLAADLALWHRAIDLVGAGLATVLANFQVPFIAVLAWIIYRERPTRAALLAMPFALVGVVLAAGVGQSNAYGTNPVLGALLGILTAVAYTGYLLFFRRATRDEPFPVGPLMDATLGTATAGLVFGLVSDPHFNLVPTWPAHGWLIALGLGSQALGWFAIARALPRLPALETSVLLLLQPCLTLLWGILLFAESPALLQWLGVAFVLGSVAVVSLKGAAEKQAPEPPAPVRPAPTAVAGPDDPGR